MTRIQEIQQQTISLTASEKAKLAADLLESLPPILDDEDEGVAEAHRRDREMEMDPTVSITWDQVRRGIGR